MFNDIYKNKKVLVTGNTGFKGSWLTTWLLSLGADVVGVSVDTPTEPSMYNILGLEKRIKQYWSDVRNLEYFKEIVLGERPDFIFHLAAQSIVSKSYENSLYTMQVNHGGTVNLLEILKDVSFRCNVVLITSDKCYENVEQVWGYRENDTLGGNDIYSCSKSISELSIKAYYNSFLKYKKNIKISTSRAGNVIGGGDWAPNRIICDCIRSWSVDDSIEIRSPLATRPWQHVLEPLGAYLLIGYNLYNDKDISGESFNVGPSSDSIYSVKDVVCKLYSYWKKEIENPYKFSEQNKFKESTILKISSDKILSVLGWRPTLDYEKTVKFTGEWYNTYYDNQNMLSFTINQIQSYYEIALEKGIIWTQ